ncbi:Hypothetical predicted protein [Lecanosticta acicola]|uniref:Cyclin N-terminal domain-containing protein n=1 Tax=Lecanosticta acicola TaxID=111012 RepID=A0AAI9EBP1_9PEZI|nr:Hypothetical predicted protein [Lecanosticta acicola]
MHRLPPSPALSACHSLSDDDLDAFLANQGSLSHFPTPPPPQKRSPFVDTIHLADDARDEDEDGESQDYFYIATLFAEQASIDICSTPGDVQTIQQMLIRAALRLEVVATALNVLTALHSFRTGFGHFDATPPELLVVCAFSLAVSYMYDDPASSSWWSREVCRGVWSAKQIDQSSMELLSHLDFRLHSFTATEEIERTIDIFVPPSMVEAEGPRPDSPTEKPEKQPLKLTIDGTLTDWEGGQMTPASTPPCTAVPQVLLGPFLPLL